MDDFLLAQLIVVRPCRPCIWAAMSVSLSFMSIAAAYMVRDWVEAVRLPACGELKGRPRAGVAALDHDIVPITLSRSAATRAVEAEWE